MRFTKSVFFPRVIPRHVCRGIICFILLHLQLNVASAQQTMINLSEGQRPQCSTGSWTVVNNRYHCVGGGASITIASNSTVIANTAASLYAEGGVRVRSGSQVGTPARPIGLGSSYGLINVEDSVVNGGLFASASSFVMNGTINLSSANIRITNSVVTGNASTRGTVSVDSSSLQGDINANNGVTASNNSSVIGDITASNGSINILNSESVGFLTSGCCTITGTNSNFEGGAIARSGISISGGNLAGDFSLTTNNTISLSGVDMASGSLDAWNINIDDNSTIGSSEPILITIGNNLNSGSNINAICDPHQDRCVGSTAPPPEDVDNESLLPMCTDIWRDAQRQNNVFYPESDFSLPEDALSNNPIPASLQPTDYLRRGDFTAVGNNWAINQPTGRVYADGNLTIERGRRLNQGGPPERLILVVTGDLVIEPDVIINGFIYVQGSVTYAPRATNRNCFIFCGPWFATEPVASINGGVTAGGTVSTPPTSETPAGRREASVHNPAITYTEPSRNIQGGGFCLAQPRQEVWLEFSDSNWTGSPGSVADSSPLESPQVSEANGFSFPSSPLQVSAPRAPSFQGAGSSSALPANTQNNFFGTCSYADFDRDEQQFFEVDNNPRVAFNGSFTIGTWVFPESYPSTDLMTIASRDENYEFHIRNDGRINWWWQNRNNQVTQFNSDFSVPAGQWSYVGVRYTPSTQTIFRWDGSQLRQTTRNFDTGLAQNNQSLLIGSDHGNFPERSFDGRIDEFRVFKGALTNAEIVALGQERASECGLQLTCNADDFSSPGEFPLSWQTTRSSGNFSPQIENGRLRLNQAIGDQATVASLRRAFPAANNYIEVTFDFYAYAGNPYNGSIGGDGIAVVFSDASVVPVPGSYGGSLGYAQRDATGGGVTGDGFAGGWLGVGLDIYGNFSQGTEGRVGGLPTSLANSRNRVSLRGAKETNYAFITASPQLSGMSSASSSPPAQPDRYRIIIDSRSGDESRITVQRQRAGQSDFTSVVEQFNVFDLDGQQPSVPDLLRISLTGSTGGAFSVHEIDNFEVCALQSQPLGTALDHVRLSHSGELVSCFNESIEVQGCLNDDCSQTYAGVGNVVVQASQGEWTNTNVNGQNASIPLAGGRGAANLRLPEGGTASFTLLATDPVTVSNQPLRCYLGNVNGTRVPCDLLFKTAGLEFVDPDAIDQRDQRPVIAGNSSSRALRTVETNTLTGACQARVESQTLATEFRLTCLDPGSCIDGQSAIINGTSFLTNDESINLSFDQRGVAILNNFSYSDVGRIRLGARLSLPENTETGDPEVELSGTSLPFVSTPYSLNVFALNDDTSPRTDLSLFKAAGEPFTLAIESRNAAGALTPNFGNEAVAVNVTANFVETIFPSGGFPGELVQTSSFTRTAATPGVVQSPGATWSEVGNFSMRAQLPDNLYLGVDTENREDALRRPLGEVGQFYPHHYLLADSSMLDGCTHNDFTYMGQPAISVNFTAQANNSGGLVTRNYGFGNYPGTANIDAIASSMIPQDQANDNFPDRFTLMANSWNEGVLDFSADDLAFERHSDETPDGPYPELQIGLQVSNAEGARTFLAEDFDGSSQRGPTVLLSGALDMRYGRFVLENTFGPETEDLLVELRAEYWDGERFQVNVNDNCTTVDPVNLNIISNPANIGTAPGGFAATLEDGMAPLFALVWQAPEAPNTVGDLEFEYEAPAWLRFPWQDTEGNAYDNPRAFAGFGQYRGNDRVIYWLELR